MSSTVNILEDLAKQATKVSELLERIQEQLQEAPAKVEVSVTGERCEVGFGRLQGEKGQWRLWYCGLDPGDEPIELCAASMLIKAEASPLIPPLVEKFHVMSVALAFKMNEAYEALANFIDPERTRLI